MTIKNALIELYVKYGGSLSDSYPEIANGDPVSKYKTIVNVLKAIYIKLGGEYPGQNIPFKTISNILQEMPASSGGDANLDDFISGSVENIDCNLEVIPDFAFSAKNDLESVNIPNATYIGQYAFSSAGTSSASGSGSGSNAEAEDSEENDSLVFNNERLTTVFMPNMTNIAKYAFKGDSNLEITELPDSIAIIDDGAFDGCAKVNLSSLPANLTYIGNRAFNGCEIAVGSFPSSLTYIGDDAISDQQNLDIQTLADTNLTYIGSGISLQQIHTYMMQFCDVETGIIDISRIPTFWFNVKISDSISHGQSIFRPYIGGAVYEYPHLPEIVSIPVGVNRIPDNAFANMSGYVTELTLPDGLVYIGNNAFAGCHDITSLTIPNSVTTIGTNAFSTCQSLQSLTLSESINSIEPFTFSACNHLQNLEIPENVTRIEYNAFNGCCSLSSLVLHEGLESIHDSAFSGCTLLESLIIPNSVFEIGGSAFSGCNSLSSLTIGTGLSIINNGTFYGCSSLQSLVIPNNIEIIGSDAFGVCYNLSLIDLTALDFVIQLYGSSAAASIFGIGDEPRPSYFVVKFSNQNILNAYTGDSDWSNDDFYQYFVVET